MKITILKEARFARMVPERPCNANAKRGLRRVMFANNRTQLSALTVTQYAPLFYIYSLPAALRSKYAVSFPIGTPAANAHR